MSRNSLCLFVALCATAAIAQSTPSTSNPPTQSGSARRGGTPCWQQAGIEKSVMEQRWSIERETHSQVEAVCSNTSLTPQQKQQQVRELHQQARQKVEGLVTPEQEKALTACQQERGMNHPGGGMGEHQGMGGGCGEWRGGQRGGAPNGAQGMPNGGSSNPPPSHE